MSVKNCQTTLKGSFCILQLLKIKTLIQQFLIIQQLALFKQHYQPQLHLQSNLMLVPDRINYMLRIQLGHYKEEIVNREPISGATKINEYLFHSFVLIMLITAQSLKTGQYFTWKWPTFDSKGTSAM